MRDSYTNRKHCPSHEMWLYERDGRWRGWSFDRGSTEHPVIVITRRVPVQRAVERAEIPYPYKCI